MVAATWVFLYLTGSGLITACAGTIYYLDLDQCDYYQGTVYLMSGDSAVLMAASYGTTGTCSYSISMISSFTHVSLGPTYISSCSNTLAIVPFYAASYYYSCYDSIPYSLEIYDDYITVRFTRLAYDMTSVSITITNGVSDLLTTKVSDRYSYTKGGYTHNTVSSAINRVSYRYYSSFPPSFYIGIAAGVITSVVVAIIVTSLIVKRKRALRALRIVPDTTVVPYPSNPGGQTIASASVCTATTHSTQYAVHGPALNSAQTAMQYAAYNPTFNSAQPATQYAVYNPAFNAAQPSTQYAVYNSAFSAAQPSTAFGFTGQPYGTAMPPIYEPPPYSSLGPV